jgi:hypothetical protein
MEEQRIVEEWIERRQNNGVMTSIRRDLTKSHKNKIFPSPAFSVTLDPSEMSPQGVLSLQTGYGGPHPFSKQLPFASHGLFFCIFDTVSFITCGPRRKCLTLVLA